MRRWQDNARAQLMNDVFRERAYLNGVDYIDAYPSFVDEGGGDSDYGPDITGKVSRPRDTYGLFTDIGYRSSPTSASATCAAILQQAKDERAVPLAGDDAEQACVDPDRARFKAEAAPAPAGQAKPRRPAPRYRPMSGPRAEGGDRQGRHQGGGTGRHRANCLGRYRASRDPVSPSWRW